jgi:hypothetical protein
MKLKHLKAMGMAVLFGLVLSVGQAQADVANLFTDANVASEFETWTTSQSTVLANAVKVGFAIIAVFTAVRYITRLATKARA